MISKQSWLSIADNTTVSWLQTFQLYKGFFRKSTKIGFFIKGSAKVVRPPRIEYKGYKFKFNKKGDICRAFIIRTVYNIVWNDGSVISFKSNNAILLKKRHEPKSKYLHGPTSYKLKRKKFLMLFSFIF